MTILHDNLYTKRAVSVLRGRNRYLSRAVWTVRVNAWRNRKLLQNGPVMKPNKPNSMTCSAERLVALNNFHPLRRQQNRPLPSLNPPKGRPVAHRAAPPPAHRAAPPPAHRAAPPRGHHRDLQVAPPKDRPRAPLVDPPPVHLPGLLLTQSQKHPLRRQLRRQLNPQQNRWWWNPNPALNRWLTPTRRRLPMIRS